MNAVIVTQNLIQKQKTQLSNLEDENALLQAEVRKMESQVRDRSLQQWASLTMVSVDLVEILFTHT